MVIGWPHPRPSPKARETSERTRALVKNGTITKLAAPIKKAQASTIFSFDRAISDGMIIRTMKADTEYIESTTPIAEADSPIPFP